MDNPLSGVTSWLYVLGDLGAADVAAIAASEAGLVVIDATDFSKDVPRAYAPSDLDALRGDTPKLLLSYLSIGEAEEYRAYWRSDWAAHPPDFLFAANPEWPDNHLVKYWHPAWQDIIFRAVDDGLRAGFDGFYLDIVDAFEAWEAAAPDAGIDYRQEMVQFVAAIDAHAAATLRRMGGSRDVVLIAQNGESLVDDPTYRAHVDGQAKEDLRFAYLQGRGSGFAPVSADAYSDAMQSLDKAMAAGMKVFLVEYLTPFRQVQYADMLQAELAMARAKGMAIYVAQDRDLTQVYDQPLPEAGGRTDSFGATPQGTVQADVMTGTERAESLSGRAGADQIDGHGGDDLLYGNSGRDRLEGGTGNDTLSGGSGADILSGGAGDDLLIGGGGADVFVFSPHSGHDRIADFAPGTDRIVIQGDVGTPAGVSVIDQGPDAEIRLTGASITLLDVDHRAVSITDFLFD